MANLQKLTDTIERLEYERKLLFRSFAAFPSLAKPGREVANALTVSIDYLKQVQISIAQVGNTEKDLDAEVNAFLSRFN